MDTKVILSGLPMRDDEDIEQYSPASSSPSSFRIHRSNLNEVSSIFSSSDMDISSSDMDISSSGYSSEESSTRESDNESHSTSTGSCDTSPYDADSDASSINVSLNISDTMSEQKIPPVISFLDDEEIATLLGENRSLPPPEPREVLEKDNVDIIASFNVRNKYDHTTAAELLIHEKIAFLAIQEPYASSHKAAESWKAYQKLELESARISCYETPYQMILFDAWKWGGKVLTAFQSLQYGRVASISFNLGDKLKIGIVSIYAPTKENLSNSSEDSATHPSMKITNNLVQKIISKWKSTHPDMITIILGDFQETVSSLDRDNLGKYRSEPSNEGVLANLLHSHSSIVRERNPDISYVTRFGKEGARGIDHILFPSDDKFQNVCVEAGIKRDTGSNYFPSDHSMITCSINRKGQNNNCGGYGKIKYDFNKLFSIKMKQSGRLGENIDFDTSQFKDCKRYKDQLNLFLEIQKRTGNLAPRTKTHLHELELRADALFQTLWKDGISQKVDNLSNDLVEISDMHAMELSYILQKFDSAVKTVMGDLKLADEKNTNEAAGATRGRLRTRKGFKIFNNLPVPTKLRYLKTNVEAKIKEISKNIYWLKEFHIRTTYDKNADITSFSQDPFWEQWNRILLDKGLIHKANEVLDVYEKEVAERISHVDSIQHEQNKSCTRKGQNSSQDTSNHASETQDSAGNTLPHVSDNVTRLLNFWLSKSNCNQGFNASTPSGGSAAFLTHRILDWKETLLSVDANDFDFSLPRQSKMMHSTLEKAQNDLHKLCIQITKLQSFYRKSTLDYYLDTNNISSFTNKVSFKSKQAPAAHTSIWDPSLMEFRNCTDELEELRATSAFHGNWMANSKAAETCAFAEIISVGRLGFRGVKLKPNRVVTMNDIATLIPNGNALPRKIKKAFVKAHGLHTANLFRGPKTDNHEFFYPFYLLDEKGSISNEETLEKGFWKSIASVPSKARFEGFQLAVLGRFSVRWRKMLFKIIKLILIMRYIPSSLKKMARFPIPKPGRQNEYRPISLCHDLYCYIMSVVTSYSSAAIERAGILHEGITAYQKGKGCANLVTTELCFREDCLESSVPAVQIDEDEEKFFDRIPVEILLAAMRINGFPTKGYIEIKASAMESKTVEIITAKGITYARFVCGLEQGNPDSPTVSNLVIKFKHDIWNFISKDIKLLLERNNSLNEEGYKFNSVDRLDGTVYICKIGYSDDNSKYISLKNESDLLALVKYFTQLSGDLSMVTKIGRKSAKCEVQFFNITAEMALKMQKVWSTAWSFVDDSPIEEQIPFKIYLRPEELQVFFRISNFSNLSEEQQSEWYKIIGNNAHKHLGLACTLGADTSLSWKKTIEKMREKLTTLNVYKMHISAQKKCFNMLVGTIPTFAPIQVNYPCKELLQFDIHAALVCMKSNGLSKSDTKIRMFLPEKYGGLGLRSTMELDIISIAREFEIISNNVSLDSKSFRTRISALENYPLYSLFENKNHARDAISKLARYGVYVRCAEEVIINSILSAISSSSKLYLPFNHPGYKDKCTLGIGLGKERNLKLMYGGPFHKILQMLEDNNWKSSNLILDTAKPHRISIKKLLQIYKDTSKHLDKDFEKFFSFWEWRNPNFQQLENIPGAMDKWKARNYDSIRVTGKFHPTEQSQNTFRSHCISSAGIHWHTHVKYDKVSEALLFNSYMWEGRFLEYLMNSKSPVLVATDGSHSNTGPANNTSSSFVICVLHIKDNEDISSGEWMDRPVIPLLGRVSMLPQNFGTCKADIAHGEFCALLFAETALLKLPRITISDSKAIREQFLKIKNLPSGNTDRNFIRKIAGGIGKFVSGAMKDSMFEDKTPDLDAPEFAAMKIISKELIKRNASFLAIAKQWITPTPSNDQEELSGWEEKYFDDDKSFPILKVNSHQLDETGTRMRTPPRYKKLIPNLAMLSANHHADICAEHGRSFNSIPYTFNEPPPYMRYFITCGGKHIDRNISDFLHTQFSILKIRKLRLKKTQGLLWRILENTTTKWEILQLHKGWLRSLLGLSSTHSRRTYKSEVYRECCKERLLSASNDTCKLKVEFEKANAKKTIDMLKTCAWCKRNSGLQQIGNRNHALLYCDHEDLSSFRGKVSNLIESKFRLFFLELSRATNPDTVSVCIRKVESAFLDLQSRNVDRLIPMEPSQNIRYLPIHSILSRENLLDIRDALQCPNFNFCCEVFGMLPNFSGIPIRDDQIGLADCTWLGLMPRTIDIILEDACMSVRNFIIHKETVTHISTHLRQSWLEIKNLIMGKAIGLHRIICSTGKSLEKIWRKEYNIDINTIKKLKQESNPTDKTGPNTSSPTTTGRKRKFSTCGGIPVVVSSKQRKITDSEITVTNLTMVEKKDCTGLTCSKKHGSWYPNSDFAQNQIKASIRQCQRCSRYMTAIKFCIKVLEILEATPSKCFETLIQFIQESQNTMRYKYHIFVKKLNASLPAKSSVLLNFTPGQTNRVSDRVKLISNIFCIAISKATHNFTFSDCNLPRRALTILNSLLSCKESDFNLDREAEAKIKLLINNNKETPRGKSIIKEKNHKCPIISGSKETQSLPQKTHSNKSHTSNVSNKLRQQSNSNHNVRKVTFQETIKSNPTSKVNKSCTTKVAGQSHKIHLQVQNVSMLCGKPKEILQSTAAAIIRPHRYLSGDAMTRAIEVLRSFHVPNVFIASAEAATRISSWRLNDDWKNFARMFGNREICENKLNGTYLIPIFSGDTTMGHWSLYIVEKLSRRNLQAWCMDSLGTGNTKGQIHSKITAAFAPGRARMVWKSCTCRTQEEVECGPRTILAMKLIMEGLRENRQLEECIRKATLTQYPHRNHTSAMIREEIAYFVNLFNPDMITPPIRMRIRNGGRAPNPAVRATNTRDNPCVILE